MRIETAEDRRLLDTQVDAVLSESFEDDTLPAKCIRAGLARLRPQELVSLWFRKDSPEVPVTCALSAVIEYFLLAAPPSSSRMRDQLVDAAIIAHRLKKHVATELPHWLSAIRPLIGKRSVLFAWVYGPSPATRELIYVRLPSRERRQVIGYLRAGLRRRYPWLTTKLVSAMAFRPEAFAGLAASVEGDAAWGPLYRRVVIQKGRKSRYLWVPNPVLKRLQKSLLRLLQPTVDRGLGAHVYGARIGQRGPTFANAARHLHRGTIVTLDIKDFFPSTTVGDVIRGLQYLAAKNPLAIDAGLRSEYGSVLPNGSIDQSVAWTDDLRVFVARLGTHRGRLPQGSPLSPLLANVAFSPYDDRIAARLTQEFGADKVRYTRYFDDLTISLAPGGGGNRAGSRTEFRRTCEQVVAQSLGGSSYRLNHRKTRCGGTRSGHRVTGLVVRKERVSLPRTKARELRAIIRAMHAKDFVDIAMRWSALAARPDYAFESVTRGHRAKPGHLRRYRLSAERMAVFMLRVMYPDLTMECLLPHWYPWREQFQTVEGTARGKKIWPLVELVLSTLWTGHTRVTRVKDSAGVDITNEIVIEQDGVATCRFSAESALDFFVLPRNEAIAVVECWHHFRGVLGFLSACPERREFERILSLRDALDRGLGEISIGSTQEPVNPPVPEVDDSPLPLTHELKFGAVVNDWDDCFGEYVRHIQANTGDGSGSLRAAVRAGFTRSPEGFGDWIQRLRNLLDLCDRLPDAGQAKKKVPAQLLYDYIRIRADLAAQLVGSDYRCLAEFEQKVCKRGASTPPAYDRLQVLIVEALLFHFSETNRAPKKNERWMGGLWENTLRGPVGSALEEQAERLSEFHAQARTDDGEPRFFRSQSGYELENLWAEIARPVETASSDRVWAYLQDFSKSVYKVTAEAIEPALCSQCPPAGTDFPDTWRRGKVRSESIAEEDRPILSLLEKLRNRASHGNSPERRKEWVWIQTRMAEYLGRDWKSESGNKHPEYHAPDDLVLTAHEGTVMKIHLLRGVNRWLKRIVETEWWKRGVGG